MDEQEHKTRVYWGDWHVFAYCTCGWEGTRTNHYYADSRHEEAAEAHKRSVSSKLARFKRWLRSLAGDPS